MEAAYLPIGEGYSGEQQLEFLQTQYYSTLDPDTKNALGNAIQGLTTGEVGGIPVVGGKTDLQRKMQEIYDSGVMLSGAKDVQQMNMANKAQATSNPSAGDLVSSSISDRMKKWGSDVLALVIGIIFLIAGIYVYKSE